MNKKLLALILCIFCLASIFVLASCGGNSNTDTETQESVEITVYLDPNGGTVAFQEFPWMSFEEIEELPEPTKEGATFLGWALNDEIISFPVFFEEDVLLVAKWEESNDIGTETDTETETETETDEGPAVYYTVTFNPNGGVFTGELSIQVKEGDMIPEPPKPTYDGKTFNGWYWGTTATTRWNFSAMAVTGDVNLTAWYIGGGGCSHEETTPLPDKSTAATCESSGKAWVKCNKCGLQTYTILPKLGHDLVTEVVPVTCAQDGYTLIYCQREGCDESRKQEEIPATGKHTWSSTYTTIVEPTQYVGGQEAKTCEVCEKLQIFKIPSYAEMDELLWDLDIGNYTYTGGKYVNESFVNVATTAGVSATSYYSVCLPKNAIDGAASSFWCADTMADGAKFKGDEIVLTFAQKFDIGMIKLSVPHYSSWELGDDCYVSYNLEAFIDGEWQAIGILSDKNAVPAGSAAAIICELDAPINTDKLRLTVNHSTRYAPAMIYEVEAMAAVPRTERVSADLISSSVISSSGKYNSWATGTETLMDGSYDTYWQSNYNHKATVGEIYATIDFPSELFVTAVQFAVRADVNQQFSVYYLGEDGATWEKACTYKVIKGKDITFDGDSGNDGVPDGAIIQSNTGASRALFTCDIVKFTKGIKLVIDNHAEAWGANVYEFTPYTAIEQAVVQAPGNMDGIVTYMGCAHNSFKEIEKVAPNCTSAGYTIVSCYGCGLECRTDAVDAYGHLWGDYIVATAAEGTTAGTKESSCLKDDCDAVRTTQYHNDFEDPKITTYRNNAPAAWVQTLDDGNYLATYDWIIPKMKQYGWKASVMLSISFCNSYVTNWQEYLESGVLDIGSHSYTHGGFYATKINENSLLSDVHNAHYWFMNYFKGQRILTFATPNGTTSTGTSEYVTGLMASARNGGNSFYFYNRIEELQSNGYGQSPSVDENSITIDEETGEVIFTQATNKAGELIWVSTRRAWGNMNSYISKADQTEGPYAFVKKDGGVSGQRYKLVTQEPVIDETTGEQKVDENGNLVWNKLETPKYEPTSGGYDYKNGSYTFKEEGGTHALVMAPNGTYHYIQVSNAVNYVYDKDANRLVDKGITEGTYKYVSTYKDGKLWDAYYEWVEVGSYDLNGSEYVFRNDNNGEYKLVHTALGSYEKGINEILAAGGMTVECLHEIGMGGTIWSTYAATNSKFQYLKQTGIWVASYTELIQYMKEQLNATITVVERTDSKITLTLTDTLDNYMFNFPLTIEVDIDDSWVELGIVATQAGEDIEFFVKDGKVYVNAVPDAGDIVITPAILCTDGTIHHEFEWTYVDEPTCTEEGLKNGICTRCEFERENVVAEALGHTFKEEWDHVSDADCTTDAKVSNTCQTCGYTEYKVVEPAYGHTFGDWTAATITEEGIQGTSTCTVCLNEVTVLLENVTKDSFNTPTTQGDAWGDDTGALINGDYKDTPIAPKETGEFSVTMEAKAPTYVDLFAVVGYGSSQYTVVVYYEDGTNKELLPSSFGEDDAAITIFTIDKVVTKFVVTMPEPSNGSDRWSEIGVFTVKE